MATNPVVRTSTTTMLRLAVGERQEGIHPGHVLIGTVQPAWRLGQWRQRGYVVRVGERHILTRKGWDLLFPDSQHYGYL